DIDEQKRKELSLRDSNVELERLIEERVQELQRAETQVQQLQKMDAIGRLAGGMAHDFNNLLAAINMYCDLLSDDAGESENIKSSVEEVRKIAQRGATLTRQLLVFSRKQVVHHRSIALNDLIGQMNKMFARLVPENIAIQLKLSEADPHIKADP